MCRRRDSLVVVARLSVFGANDRAPTLGLGPTPRVGSRVPVASAAVIQSGADTTFARLSLRAWRQFDDVDLAFHPRLTVVTGANAAGKTTLLSLLAAHFGWPTQFVATPGPRRGKGPVPFLSGLWRRALASSVPSEEDEVGTLSYSTGAQARLTVPRESGSAAFSVSVHGQQQVAGLFIPSHRPSVVYQPVGAIPTTLPDRRQILDAYLTEVRSRHLTPGGGGTGPLFRMKEALISLSILGYGNQAVESNPAAIELYDGFVDVLKDVLPPSIGFRGLSIRMPEVVLLSDSGDFSFDAVSGGVAAIIDLAWQIYLGAAEMQRIVVVIDEPENHLHPELQRSLLPGFLAAFPQVQFIVATHNPFVVGSVADSNVYALRYSQHLDGRGEVSTEGSAQGRSVSSILLETANKAGTSNEILREVLGLGATVGLWVEQRLDELVARYADEEPSLPLLRELRDELRALGMEDALPQALERVARRDQS